MLEVGGVDHHREAGAQDGFGHLVQALVGGLAGVFAVDAGLQLAGIGAGLLTEHALALDVRTQADGAQGIDQAHGHVALADSGNAVGDGQKPRRDGAVALCQVGIVAIGAQGSGALHGIGVGRHAEQGDLGPHQCTISLVEVQQFQAGVVTGQLQVLADEAARQRFQAAVFEVHGQECGVGINVGQAERFVELDAVENYHLAIDQGGVAQVDVTMALTNETFSLAYFEQAVKALEAVLGPGLQGIELLQVGLVAEERANLLEVLLHRRHDAVRGTQRMLNRDLGSLQVELGDLPGHLVDVLGGQFTVGLQGAEHLVLRELAHFQRVLDRFAFATQLRRFGATGDRQDVQVQAFGQALVQAQLFVAEVLACGQFGEIEEAEIHRLLELVGIVASQQYPGDMGLDELKLLHRVREQGGVLQRGDQGLAHGRSFWVLVISSGPLWR
ncbi:hypothetical protein D9M71_115100 [compost metagenome]